MDTCKVCGSGIEMDRTYLVYFECGSRADLIEGTDDDWKFHQSLQCKSGDFGQYIDHFFNMALSIENKIPAAIDQAEYFLNRAIEWEERTKLCR